MLKTSSSNFYSSKLSSLLCRFSWTRRKLHENRLHEKKIWKNEEVSNSESFHRAASNTSFHCFHTIAMAISMERSASGMQMWIHIYIQKWTEFNGKLDIHTINTPEQSELGAYFYDCADEFALYTVQYCGVVVCLLNILSDLAYFRPNGSRECNKIVCWNTNVTWFLIAVDSDRALYVRTSARASNRILILFHEIEKKYIYYTYARVLRRIYHMEIGNLRLASRIRLYEWTIASCYVSQIHTKYQIIYIKYWYWNVSIST